MSNTTGTRTTRTPRAPKVNADTVAPPAPADAIAASVAPAPNTTDADTVTPDGTDTPTPDVMPASDSPDLGDDITPTPAPVGPVAYVVPPIDAEVSDDERSAYIATVGQAYRDADKGDKARMKAAWAKYRSAAFDVMDVFQLTLYRDVDRVMVSAPVKVEVDPTDAYVTRLVALHLAADRLESAFIEAHPDRYAAMLTRVHNGAMDDASVAAGVTMADKLAVITGGGGNRRTGPSRSVDAHIRSALESVPVGTILTCAQITNHRSDEYGPDDAPSVGAVGAAWGRDIDGIDTDATNSKGTKGFRLVPVVPVADATDDTPDTNEA